MRGIGVRRRARQRGARIGDQPLDQRDRPRRRGDELARPQPQPQAELQHVEGRVRVPPFRQFVAPGGVELRPAQAFRILGRESVRHRAVLPFQPPPRRHPEGPLGARRHPQQSGRALDHHLAHVVLAFPDECDAAMPAIGVGRDAKRERAHPFGAEPRLAGAAPAEHQPRRPRPSIVRGSWRLLMRMREDREIAIEPCPRARRRRPRQQVDRLVGFRQKR